jgi:glycosyltransferase involved in cell wall biosynthesis
MATETTPQVSVVVPVHDGEQHLTAAIDSICSQSVADLEVIVVDDGSSDSSFDLATRHPDQRVRAFRRPHAGAGAARNHGVQMARGHLLSFLDADDLWVANKLELQLAASRQAAAPTMVFGYVQEFISAEFEAEGQSMAIPRLLPGYSVGTLLLPREAFLATGGFDERLETAEFVEWYDRVQAAGLGSLMLPDVVTRRRIHAHNVHRRRRPTTQGYTAVLKAILDRRRGSPGAT